MQPPPGVTRSNDVLGIRGATFSVQLACVGCIKKNSYKKKTVRTSRQTQAASATAPLRTGADMCKTVSGAGKCAGAKSNTVRRRSNHARTEDQAGREKRANTDAAGGWRQRNNLEVLEAGKSAAAGLLQEGVWGIHDHHVVVKHHDCHSTCVRTFICALWSPEPGDWNKNRETGGKRGRGRGSTLCMTTASIRIWLANSLHRHGHLHHTTWRAGSQKAGSLKKWGA